MAVLLAAVLAVGCASDPAPETTTTATRGADPPTEIQLRVPYGSFTPAKAEAVAVLDHSPWLHPRRTACALEVHHPAAARQPTTRQRK